MDHYLNKLVVLYRCLELCILLRCMQMYYKFQNTGKLFPRNIVLIFYLNKRPILIARDVTTKFTSRGLSNTKKINQHIFQLLKIQKGNLALFFPSYVMMEKFRALEEDWLPSSIWPSIRVIEEKRAMSKER